jgi:hypothetical protein
MRRMTKEEFLAAWKAIVPKPTLEPELLALAPRQRADVMVEVHRVAHRDARALVRRGGYKLTREEFILLARCYAAGFRQQLREAISNLSRGYWTEQAARRVVKEQLEIQQSQRSR